MQKNRIAGLLAENAEEKVQEQLLSGLINVGSTMPIIEVNDVIDGRRKRVTIGPGMYWCTRAFFADDNDEWSLRRTRRFRVEVFGGEIGSLFTRLHEPIFTRQTAEEIDALVQKSRTHESRPLSILRGLEKGRSEYVGRK